MIDRLTTISSHALAEQREPVGTNDKIGSSARVVVRNPGGYGRRPGTLERLRALSAYATHGVTLDGCSFGRTTTGKLRSPTTRAVVRRAGAYAVTLPPASAGLLTLAPGG